MYVRMYQYVSVHVRKVVCSQFSLGWIDLEDETAPVGHHCTQYMWTRMAKKNRFLSSVQHNPLAHHREGEEEEEEGVVVARGFWNLLCTIMHHSIVSAEKVRSTFYEDIARRRQAATQYPHPPDNGMTWYHTNQL